MPSPSGNPPPKGSKFPKHRIRRVGWAEQSEAQHASEDAANRVGLSNAKPGIRPKVRESGWAWQPSLRAIRLGHFVGWAEQSEAQHSSEDAENRVGLSSAKPGMRPKVREVGLG